MIIRTRERDSDRAIELLELETSVLRLRNRIDESMNPTRYALKFDRSYIEKSTRQSSIYSR